MAPVSLMTNRGVSSRHPERLFDFALDHVAAQANIAQLLIAEFSELMTLPHPSDPHPQQIDEPGQPPGRWLRPHGNARHRSKMNHRHCNISASLLRMMSCASTNLSAI